MNDERIRELTLQALGHFQPSSVHDAVAAAIKVALGEQLEELQMKFERQRIAIVGLKARLADVDPIRGSDLVRAGGGTICEVCDMPYVDHVQLERDDLILHVLCEGRVVKL